MNTHFSTSQMVFKVGIITLVFSGSVGLDTIVQTIFFAVSMLYVFLKSYHVLVSRVVLAYVCLCNLVRIEDMYYERATKNLFCLGKGLNLENGSTSNNN